MENIEKNPNTNQIENNNRRINFDSFLTKQDSNCLFNALTGSYVTADNALSCVENSAMLTPKRREKLKIRIKNIAAFFNKEISEQELDSDGYYDEN